MQLIFLLAGRKYKFALPVFDVVFVRWHTSAGALISHRILIKRFHYNAFNQSQRVVAFQINAESHGKPNAAIAAQQQQLAIMENPLHTVDMQLTL